MKINGKKIIEDADIVESLFELYQVKREKEQRGEDVTEEKAEIFNINYYLNFIAK